MTQMFAIFFCTLKAACVMVNPSSDGKGGPIPQTGVFKSEIPCEIWASFMSDHKGDLVEGGKYTVDRGEWLECKRADNIKWQSVAH